MHLFRPKRIVIELEYHRGLVLVGVISTRVTRGNIIRVFALVTCLRVGFSLFSSFSVGQGFIPNLYYYFFSEWNLSTLPYDVCCPLHFLFTIWMLENNSVTFTLTFGLEVSAIWVLGFLDFSTESFEVSFSFSRQSDVSPAWDSPRPSRQYCIECGGGCVDCIFLFLKNLLFQFFCPIIFLGMTGIIPDNQLGPFVTRGSS